MTVARAISIIAEKPIVEKIAKYSDTTLSVLLLCAAIVIVIIATMRGRPLFKALALAYVVLP